MIKIFNKIVIPEILKEFYTVFENAGFEAYLVGGAVRDIFLKKEAHDWDVTTNARPEQVMKLFKVVIPTGIAHGTVTVHFKKQEIEVTTFRTESEYSDGRHPDKVCYADNIEEDLSRRDFTMNAIAVNLKDGSIVDPFNGQKDINDKIIRTVGKPEDRFLEDGLRPVRAVRFSSQLKFKIEKETLEAISRPDVFKKITSISVERFRDELMKLLKSDKPSDGLRLLEKTGIMNYFMQELTCCRNCIQNDDRGYHIFDVMDHIFYACDGAPVDKPLIRLAALLHDCGKPESRTEKNENGFKIYNFYNHEKKSAEKARVIMTKLKFSNAETDYVCLLIDNHMFHYECNWSDAAVRRFLIKVGVNNIDDLIDLRMADMYGKYNEPVRIHDSESCSLLIELKDRINEIQAKNSVLSLKNLAVNGKDLMNAGIESGKKLGVILNSLLEAVIEDPELNTKEKLLEIALNLNK